MKVISGIYKGRNILGYDIDGTRPTMERVKESVFAMIQNYLPDSIVLDLFSGSGNLAIEALSQGAREAYAIDSNFVAYKTINKNISDIGIKNCHSIKSDYKEGIANLAEQNIKFDIVFLDPPYDTDYIKNSIDYIEKYDLINKFGLIVCESDKLERIIYPKTYEVLKEKKYGDKWVVILKKIC